MTAFVEAGLGNALVALVLAVVALVVGLACRRPAVAHALWLLVLIKLVTPPLMSVSLPWPEEIAKVHEEPRPTVTVEEIPFEIDEEPLLEPQEEIPPAEAIAAMEEFPTLEIPYVAPSWQTVFGLTWLAGSLTWFAIAARRLWHFARLLRHARPASVELTQRVAALSRTLGLRKPPRILLVQGRLSPMVWALGRVTLLVPAKLVSKMSAAALDTLLAHELAHIRRRDHWVRWLELVGLGLYWWNPVVWLARRELRQAEELCCDAWVVRCLPDARRVYATALVDALDFLSRPDEPVPALGCGLGRVDDLKWRLTMILRGQNSPRLGWTTTLGVFALAVLLLPLGPGFSPAQTRETAKSMVESLDPKSQANLKAEIDALIQRRVAEAQAKEADQRIVREVRKGEAEIQSLRAATIQSLRADIAAKMMALKQLEGRLSDTAGKSHGHQVSPPGIPPYVTLRIEVVGIKTDAVVIKGLQEKIDKALEGFKKTYAYVPFQVQVDDVHTTERPMTQPKPTPSFTTGPKKAGPSPDDRIDVLEKKLDILMRHISTLERSKARSSNGADLFKPDPGAAPKRGTPPASPRVPSSTPVPATPGEATPLLPRSR